MYTNGQMPKALNKVLQPKEIIQAMFFLLVLTIAFFRIWDGGITLKKLAGSELVEYTLMRLMAALLFVIFWNLVVYKYIIIPVKDFITRKLKIINYRHWINKLSREMGCKNVDPERIYGSLKWHNEEFKSQYPCDKAAIITPALHTFYLIPAAWLITLIWVPQWDLIVTIGVLMIPFSFIADITWENFETSIYKRNKKLVLEELKRYVDSDHEQNGFIGNYLKGQNMEDGIIEKVKKEMWDTWLAEIKAVGISDEEAEEILKKIWIKALQDCSKPCTYAELNGLCGQRVKDWCVNYRKSQKNL